MSSRVLISGFFSNVLSGYLLGDLLDLYATKYNATMKIGILVLMYSCEVGFHCVLL